MTSLKRWGTVTGAGLLSAIAASLCCITPVVALLAGTSSIAANFSWIEPLRPYLISISIAVLAFAWYLKLKLVKTKDAVCDCPATTSFLQSKKFLSILTVFAILMMTFPLYAKVFYPKPEVQVAKLAEVGNKQQATFTIQGMSCTGCELEVNNKLSKVGGIFAYKTSYPNRCSLVTFDKSKVDIKTIEAAINKTGYKVKYYKLIEDKK